MNTCVCMTESLCCSSETTTTLLIDYTTKQSKKLKVTTKKKVFFCDQPEEVGKFKTLWYFILLFFLKKITDDLQTDCLGLNTDF